MEWLKCTSSRNLVKRNRRGELPCNWQWWSSQVLLSMFTVRHFANFRIGYVYYPIHMTIQHPCHLVVVVVVFCPCTAYLRPQSDDYRQTAMRAVLRDWHSATRIQRDVIIFKNRALKSGDQTLWQSWSNAQACYDHNIVIAVVACLFGGARSNRVGVDFFFFFFFFSCLKVSLSYPDCFARIQRKQQPADQYNPRRHIQREEENQNEEARWLATDPSPLQPRSKGSTRWQEARSMFTNSRWMRRIGSIFFFWPILCPCKCSVRAIKSSALTQHTRQIGFKMPLLHISG